MVVECDLCSLLHNVNLIFILGHTFIIKVSLTFCWILFYIHLWSFCSSDNILKRFLKKSGLCNIFATSITSTLSVYAMQDVACISTTNFAYLYWFVISIVQEYSDINIVFAWACYVNTNEPIHLLHCAWTNGMLLLFRLTLIHYPFHT